MPIDTSLPLQTRVAQFPSPLETLGQIGQLRGQQQNQRIRQIQIEDREAQRTAAAGADQEEQRLRDLFNTAGTEGRLPSQEELFGSVGPERGTKILEGIAALQAQRVDTFEQAQGVIGSVIGGLLALPDAMRPEAYQATRTRLVDMGVVDPAQVPEQYDPAYLEQAQRELLSPDKAYDVAHPAPPAGFTLSEGQTRFSGAGDQIAGVPKSTPTPPVSAGFTLTEGQTRYGPDGTPIASRPRRPGAAGDPEADTYKRDRADYGDYLAAYNRAFNAELERVKADFTASPDDWPTYTPPPDFETWRTRRQKTSTGPARAVPPRMAPAVSHTPTAARPGPTPPGAGTDLVGKTVTHQGRQYRVVGVENGEAILEAAP